MKNFVYLFFCLHLVSCSRNLVTEKEPELERRQLGQLSENSFSEGMKEYILEHYSQARAFFEKSLAQNSQLAACHFMLARIDLQGGKIQDGLLRSLKAIKLEPTNKYYYLLAAQIYEKENNFLEASRLYEKMIEVIPGTEEYNFDLAATYILAAKYQEAIALYTKLEGMYGKSEEIVRQKQQLFLKMNKLDQALSEGYTYLQHVPDNQDFKLLQAQILKSNNKPEEAILFLNQTIKENPDNGEAHKMLLDLYKQQGQLSKASHQIEFILSNPEIDLQTKLAVMDDMKAGISNEAEQKSAQKYADLLVRTNGSDAKVMVTAGDIYYLSDKKEIALDKYVKAKAIEQNNFTLWDKIISLDAELNKPDSMIVHSEAALEVFPNQAALWLYNGSAYLQKKNSRKAIDAFEQGLLLTAGNDKMLSEFKMRLGDSYNDIKDFQKSDKLFEEVLQADADNEYVLNNYSYYLSLRKTNLDRAKEMSQKLVKRFPTNANYLDTHAWVLYTLKDYPAAKQYLEKAVSLTNNGTIVEHYGDVLFQLGMTNEAVAQWLKAKSLGDTSVLIDKKIQSKELYE